MAQKKDKLRVLADGNGIHEQIDYDEDGVNSSGGSYVIALKIDTRQLREGSIILKNTGANSIYYNIIASNAKSEPSNDSDASWATLRGDTSLAASTGEAIETWSGKYRFIWVRIKDNAGVGTLKVWHRGTN